MAGAYSFTSDLTFREAVKMFNATDKWFRQPNLEGKWLIRDNDRLGDYLSWYDFDEGDPSILKKISIFFDTRPRQITFSVSRLADVPIGTRELNHVHGEHQQYVLERLLPAVGARNIQPSDFER